MHDETMYWFFYLQIFLYKRMEIKLYSEFCKNNKNVYGANNRESKERPNKKELQCTFFASFFHSFAQNLTFI